MLNLRKKMVKKLDPDSGLKDFTDGEHVFSDMDQVENTPRSFKNNFSLIKSEIKRDLGQAFWCFRKAIKLSIFINWGQTFNLQKTSHSC